MMSLATGHRCIIIWMMTIIVLACLVLHLDSGPEKHPPVLLFSVLAATDLVIFTSFFLTVYKAVEERTDERIYYNLRIFLRLNYDLFGQFLCVCLKVLFETLLCLRLCFQVAVPLWLILSPLWMFLTIIVATLSVRVYLVHT
ncbi:unnamed protein product [Auanema sp. JU1783]|nr:unnamed protein product [Auanema sp. JU1783]